MQPLSLLAAWDAPPWAFSAAASFLTTVVVAVLAARLTAHLALRRFRAEKWWDRKAEAYSRIVEALYVSAHFSDEMSQHLAGESQMSDKYKEKSIAAFMSANTELRKASGVGAFIISRHAAEVLDEMFKHIDVSNMGDSRAPWDTHGSNLVAYRDAIEKLRSEAKRDLKV